MTKKKKEEGVRCLAHRAYLRSGSNYATLCHCSESTARRRIAQMLSEGTLEPSGFAKGLYKLTMDN